LNQLDFAKAYLNESKLRLETAQNVIDKDAYAYCIRQSQEAVELSLKAALRLIGIDFPKWHDVGIVLIKEKERFPTTFQDNIHKLASISKYLAAQREPAMYGEEISRKSPSSMFSKEDAQDAIKKAKICIEDVEKLFRAI